MFNKLLVFGFLSLNLFAQQGYEMPPQGGHPKPPQEALDACSQKKSGDTCEFIGFNKEKLKGSCFQPNSSLPLACRPNNMPAKK